MKINKPILIATESFKIKEQINENSGEVEGVVIEGIALKGDIPTRNGVAYTTQSMMDTCKTLIGKPLLDSHNDTSWKDCLGHVTEAWMKDNVLMYRANIDPKETKLISKLKRRDIPGVSVQVLVDEVDEKTTPIGEDYISATINEFLELSIVTIPGERDTSAALVESFHKFKEQDKPKIGGYAVGQKDEEEDLSTDNGGALIGIGLPKDKKIKKLPEPEKLIKLDPRTGIPEDREDDLKDKDDEVEVTYGGKTIRYTKHKNPDSVLRKQRLELYKQKLIKNKLNSLKIITKIGGQKYG